ncbi:MAG: ferredoxin [Puniceicoccales bacterium]|jgi:ferredoxin|nr:ferredoxin [Puniceicoccales bacterium]
MDKENENGRSGRNVPGRFSVEAKKCIDCDLCRDIAPEFFARDDDGYSKIVKQPTSTDEVETFVEAMDSCPVSAIVDNGE